MLGQKGEKNPKKPTSEGMVAHMSDMTDICQAKKDKNHQKKQIYEGMAAHMTHMSDISLTKKV